MTVLAGGIGSRFWPASTPTRPKQLLPLAGPDPLIVDTVRRAELLANSQQIRLLTGGHLAEAFRAALPTLSREAMLIEPMAKGTAPVLTWAAWEVLSQDPGGLIISLHADHVIHPEAAFVELLRDAGEVARGENLLMTVGVPPTRPEPGYGYIRPGKALDALGSAHPFVVDAFVEKPDRETALSYISDGYLWNSGIFLWPAALFLEEVRKVAPEIGRHLPLLEKGDVEAFFAACPTITVDEAIMERSTKVGAVPATFQWDDVGSWEALTRTTPLDTRGNALSGQAHVVAGENNVVFAEGGSVVLWGMDDVVVVRTKEVTLVLPRERAPELKDLLRELPEHLRDPQGSS